jgi:hypothetical protein
MRERDAQANPFVGVFPSCRRFGEAMLPLREDLLGAFEGRGSGLLSRDHRLRADPGGELSQETSAIPWH